MIQQPGIHVTINHYTENIKSDGHSNDCTLLYEFDHSV